MTGLGGGRLRIVVALAILSVALIAILFGGTFLMAGHSAPVHPVPSGPSSSP